MHLGAILLATILPVGWPARLALWAAIIGSLHHSLRVHAWRSGPLAIEAIELDNEGMAAVRFAGNPAWQPVRITSRFVHPWATLMTLRLESRRWPVNLVIPADAVEPEAFRRWRVALKFQALAG